MKQTLLLICICASTLVTAQKKVIAKTIKTFDATSEMQYADSISYAYSNYQGALTSNKPEFSMPPMQLIWRVFFNEPEIKFSTSSNYSGSNYPLYLNDERQKRFDLATYNTLVDSSTENGDRVIYTYTSFNALASKTLQNENMGTWMDANKDVYEYDNQNRLSRIISSTNNGTTLEIYLIDSISYSGNAIDPTETSIWTSNDGVSFTNAASSLISYSSGKPTSVDYYQNGIFSIYGTYHYGNNDQLDSLVAFNVVNNIPSEQVAKFAYTYNSSGNVIQELQTGMDNLITKFAYNADQFVTNMEVIQSGGIVTKTNFYYQNVAETAEMEALDLAVYPNPNNGHFKVVTSENIMDLKIIDLQGRIVLEQTTNEVDLDGFKSGLYEIMVSTSNGNGSIKVMKQ